MHLLYSSRGISIGFVLSVIENIIVSLVLCVNVVGSVSVELQYSSCQTLNHFVVICVSAHTAGGFTVSFSTRLAQL